MVYRSLEETSHVSNMVFTTLTFLASALMIVYLLFKSWTNKASKPLPPGPRGVAALLTFLKAARNTTVHFYSETWAKQYGDIVSVTLFNRTLCFVNEVKLAKQLLCDNGYKAYTNDRPKSFVSSFIFKGRGMAFSPAGMHHTAMRKTFHNSLRLYGDGIQAFEDTIMDELQNLVMEMNSHPEFQLEEVIGTSLLNVIYILVSIHEVFVCFLHSEIEPWLPAWEGSYTNQGGQFHTVAFALRVFLSVDIR